MLCGRWLASLCADRRTASSPSESSIGVICALEPLGATQAPKSRRTGARPQQENRHEHERRLAKRQQGRARAHGACAHIRAVSAASESARASRRHPARDPLRGCVRGCVRGGGEDKQAGGWTFSRRNMIGESTAVSLFIDACTASPGRGETQPYRGQRWPVSAMPDLRRRLQRALHAALGRSGEASFLEKGAAPYKLLRRDGVLNMRWYWWVYSAGVPRGVTVRRAGEASFFGMSMRLKTSASAYGS